MPLAKTYPDFFDGATPLPVHEPADGPEWEVEVVEIRPVAVAAAADEEEAVRRALETVPRSTGWAWEVAGVEGPPWWVELTRLRRIAVRAWDAAEALEAAEARALRAAGGPIEAVAVSAAPATS